MSSEASAVSRHLLSDVSCKSERSQPEEMSKLVMLQATIAVCVHGHKQFSEVRSEFLVRD